MSYFEEAINHWIDKHEVSDLDHIPWMNQHLKSEEINFWVDYGIIDKNLNRTTKTCNQSVVFLDVDGVLNHSESEDAIDSDCLQNLCSIVKQTNAVIVLVSSWKCGWFKDDKTRQDDDADYLDSRLKKVDLRIFDKSSRYASGRGIEIVDWVMRFNTFSFVILDDDFSHYKDTPLEPYCIKTDYYNSGLTTEHAREVISILLSNKKLSLPN